MQLPQALNPRWQLVRQLLAPFWLRTDLVLVNLDISYLPPSETRPAFYRSPMFRKLDLSCGRHYFSPLAEHLARTNNAPTVYQKHVMSGTLKRRSALLEKTRQILSRSELEGLEKEIRVLESIVHPFRQLSIEVWQRVFLHVFLEPDYHFTRSYFDGASHAPYNLLHVCQSWDAFTLSYSALWTYFCVQLTKDMNITQHPIQLRHMKQHITLSKNLPLTFDLHCDGQCPLDPTEVFSILQSCFSRWQDVFIGIPHGLLTSLFGNAVHLPNLTTLHVEVSHLPPGSSRVVALNAPSLQRLYGRPRSVAQFDYFQNSISLYQSFVLESSEHQLLWAGVQQEDLIPLLSTFGNLTVLRVRSTWYGINTSLPAVVLPTVTHLQCTFHLLPYLQCPNLTSLDIASDRTQFSAIKAPRLIRFLKRNGQHIQMLTIRDPHFSISILSVIAALPALKEVHMLYTLGSMRPSLMSDPASFANLPKLEQKRIRDIPVHFDVSFLHSVRRSLPAVPDPYMPLVDSDAE